MLIQVIHQKPKKTLEEISRKLCPVSNIFLGLIIKIPTYTHAQIILRSQLAPSFIPQVLSIQQLYRISTMYWDDKYGTHSVSPDVRLQPIAFQPGF